MKTSLTRFDDMRSYDIVFKLLDGVKLNNADAQYITLLRIKMETALTTLSKENISLYSEVIGRYIIIEHYISLFSGMLFERGDNE